MGDLNDEPQGLPLTALHAHMHRARALGGRHWQDDDVKRVHLYNCAWRLFGEINPHSPGMPAARLVDAAGTSYWAQERRWTVIDHLIISGSLLRTSTPYLDEAEVLVVALPEFIEDGLPVKFRSTRGGYCGLSDHLPLHAKLVI